MSRHSAAEDTEEEAKQACGNCSIAEGGTGGNEAICVVVVMTLRMFGAEQFTAQFGIYLHSKSRGVGAITTCFEG